MKAVICIYTEGSESKAAVLTYENNVVKILKAASSDNPIFAESVNNAPSNEDKVVIEDQMSINSSADDISLDDIDANFDKPDDEASAASNVELISNALKEFKLKNFEFIAIASEPSIEYHYCDKKNINGSKDILAGIIDDIKIAKGVTLGNDSVDYIDVSDKQYLSVYLDSEIPSISFINQLANKNRKRYYKISAIKSAEIALANYVYSTNKFFPEDYSLIIYTGKEYSRLLFLEGQKLSHIGATLDIGTKNLHTYDVYFSKILLEMENGGIPRLDNVVLCGDDNSENLLLSFYGTFPEANVINLKFDSFDSSLLKPEAVENLSSFSVLLAAGYEYFLQTEKKIDGISILPKSIKENQKFFQFSWHSYAMLPLLFAATFYFTLQILSNYKIINEKEAQIEQLKIMEKENENILLQISPLEKRIAGFDNTTALLDSAMTGTEIWNTEIEKIAQFMERRRNFWFTKYEAKNINNILITGITLSRPGITKFVDENPSAVLQNIMHEPIRNTTAYSFIINYTITKDTLSKP